MTDAALWVAIGAALIASALATAHLSLRLASRSKLQERATRAGASKRLAPILDDMESHALAAALLGAVFNVVVVVAAVVWSTGLGEGSSATMGSLAIAAAAAVGVILIVSEVIPASLANHASEAAVLRLAFLIRSTRIATAPIVAPLSVIDEIVRRLVGTSDATPEEEFERELRSVVSEAEHEGSFNPSERHMIEAVVDFRSRTVDEVMTPRTEVEGIEKTDDLNEIKAFIQKAGHSRIPVYEGDLDHLLGILYAKDLLRFLGQDATAFRIEDALRETLFVPETKPIAEMLFEFQRDKVHLAVVLDEYGGTAGLVTMEDVIEEIVGEIQDEFEPADEAPPEIIVALETRTLEVDARAGVNDVNDRLEAIDAQLPESDDYDTVGGFVLSHLGRLPEQGETFRKNGLLVTVLAAEPTRVVRVRIDFDAAGEQRTDQAPTH